MSACPPPEWAEQDTEIAVLKRQIAALRRDIVESIAECHARDLNAALTLQGYVLQPKRGGARGGLRGRLSWKKSAQGQVHIVRFTFRA